MSRRAIALLFIVTGTITFVVGIARDMNTPLLVTSTAIWLGLAVVIYRWQTIDKRHSGG